MTERTHPFSVIIFIIKNYHILLIPTIRLVMRYIFDFSEAFAGIEIDAVMVTALFAYSVALWYRSRITVDKNFIKYKAGIIFRSRSAIEKKEIRTIKTKQNLIMRLFGCYHVQIYLTNPKKPFINFYCGRKCAMRFIGLKRRKAEKVMKKSEAFILALAFSNSKNGLAFIITAFLAVYKGTGNSTYSLLQKVYEKSSDIARNLSFAMHTAAFIIIVGLIISFCINFIRFMTLKAYRQKGKLTTYCGIFDKICVIVSDEKHTEIALGSLFHIKKRIICGLAPGFSYSGHNIIIKEIKRGRPDFYHGVRPEKLKSFILLPFCCLMASGILSGFLINYGVIDFYASAVLILLFIWWIVCRCFLFMSTFAVKRDNDIVVGSAINTASVSAVITRENIVMAEITRNPFQRMAGTANLKIVLPSAKTEHIKLRHLTYKFCKKVCEIA